ncbi:MAG: hypothetical protein WC446_03185 [Candidatus Paceibacterota bacterium]
MAFLKLPLDISINALVIPHRQHSLLYLLIEMQVGEFFKTVSLFVKNGNMMTANDTIVITVHTMYTASLCSFFN